MKPIFVKRIKNNKKYCNGCGNCFLHYLSLNSNPLCVEYLRNHVDKINFKYLSYNKNAIDILAQNLDKVDWDVLSLNENAISILEKNLDKVNWKNLSSNKNAIHILKNNFDNIDWISLSSNENGIELIENRIEQFNKFNRYIPSLLNGSIFRPLDIRINIINHFNWFEIIKNPKSIQLVKNNIEELSKIPNFINELNTKYHFIDFLIENPQYINYNDLIYNHKDDKEYDYAKYIYFVYLNDIIDYPLKHYIMEWDCTDIHYNTQEKAVKIIKDNLHNFNEKEWISLSNSTNPEIISILEENQDKIEWDLLSRNPSGIHILEKNLDKINWSELSRNPNAIKLLENNLNEIEYNDILLNCNAIEIIKKYNKYNYNIFYNKNTSILEHFINKFHLDLNIYDKSFVSNIEVISLRPDCMSLLFKLDYKQMKKLNAPFLEELVSKVFNPIRLTKLCETYNLTFEEINDCY